MKCPACWAERAYRRDVRGWRRILLACLLIVPMKCHHCFHRFHVSWFLTIGAKMTPPPRRPTETPQAAMRRAIVRVEKSAEERHCVPNSP